MKEKLLATARGEIGYLEKATNAYLDDVTYNAGNKNYTKYARDLDALKTFYNTPKQGAAWCDVFTDWCFVKTFGADIAKKMLYQPDKSLGAGCRFSAQYYKDNGAWYTQPEAGDQIFFSDSTGKFVHTGIVTAVTDKIVYTIEGNTSGAGGVIANGGAVVAKSYSRTYNRIAGYGRPDWAIVDKLSPIKQHYAGVPDSVQDEFAKAVAAGITDGSNPTGPLLRWQGALMAYRAMKKGE